MAPSAGRRRGAGLGNTKRQITLMQDFETTVFAAPSYAIMWPSRLRRWAWTSSLGLRVGITAQALDRAMRRGFRLAWGSTPSIPMASAVGRPGVGRVHLPLQLHIMGTTFCPRSSTQRR